MKIQAGLLSVAVVSVLALSASAYSAPGARLNNAGPAARAQALAGGAAAKAIGRAPTDSFAVTDTIVDRDGTEHVRFNRSYRGLPVIGGDVVLHSKAGQFKAASATLKNALRPQIAPKIGAEDAIVAAGVDFGSKFSVKPSAKLVVYALNTTPTLAYEVRLAGIKPNQMPTDMRYYIDAANGKLLNKWDTVHSAGVPGPDPLCTGATAATGTGKTLLSGDVVLNTVKCARAFWLWDTTRGGGNTRNMANRTFGMGSVFIDADNVWGNNAMTDSATVAADAHYGVATTWDYFKTNFNRMGIANDGRGAISRVHYGRNFVNAFWSDGCFCMTFGDGDGGVNYKPLVVMEIASHEMTHGVTSSTANLVYEGESGGLNEATSDIFGTMAEFFANNPNDPGDYVIGEEVFVNNPDKTLGLRYMFKPSLDGRSPDCYSSDLGGLDVHYSSGVANHFFYLLAEGAVVPANFAAGTPANLSPASLVCNGNTALTAIGRGPAQQIWYRALTVYMTSGTNYAAARTATMSAAADLYGAGSAQQNAVAAAWSAVGVN